MAMELLFENDTVMDDAVISHIIADSFKKNQKVKKYHFMMLLIAFICTAAAAYFIYIGITQHQVTTFFTAVVIAAAAIYSFYCFFTNTTKKQMAKYQNEHDAEFKIPRKIKVYKNVLYQSAGKSHGEYKLYQFTSVEEWEHYILLRYGRGYVAIDKNGFTTGTADAFKTFMEKRIQQNI